MRNAALALAVLIAAAAPSSAMNPATEAFIKEVGADPRSAPVQAVAADTVTTPSGEVLTLDSLAAKRDATAVKSFLVTRDFLRAFKEDPNIEFPDDEFYSIVYLTVQERAYIAKQLMAGMPKPPAKKKTP
jgi:hypothetical protein